METTNSIESTIKNSQSGATTKPNNTSEGSQENTETEISETKVLTAPFQIRKSNSIVMQLTPLQKTEVEQASKEKDQDFPIRVDAEDVIEGVLRIRKLEVDDYNKGFVELLGQLTSTGNITFNMFEERWMDVRKNPDQAILVIENLKTNRIVAAGTLLIERKFIHEGGTCGHIEDIVVDTTQRGQNLGKRIVEKLRTVGEDAGCYKVILDCDEKLVGFYEKCGFQKKAIQMAWYKDVHK